MGDSISYSTLIQKIFSGNFEKYADIKNLLPEIREKIFTEEHLEQKAKVFMPNGSNYGASDGDLVRFRCFMPMSHPIQTDKYIPRFRGVMDGTSVEYTMAFFNHFQLGLFNQISYPSCATQSRQIYKVCKLPGECSWAALPQQNVSIDAIGEPKMEHEYVKLYIYDESPKPEANAIIELCGIFYAKRDPNIVPVRDSAVKYIQSENYLRYPTIHVIQHKIIELKDIVPRPNTLFANSYQTIHSFAKILTGSEIGARYFVAALASKTYSWDNEQTSQLCNLSIAFTNVTNSGNMVKYLKLLCPAVLHITITKELLERRSLYPIFDNTFGELKGNRLLHAKGTVIACDFTKYEGDAIVYDFTKYEGDAAAQIANYDEANMYVLWRLIEKQEIAYFLMAKTVFVKTDAIVIVLMPPGRIMPFSSNILVVPLLQSTSNTQVFPLSPSTSDKQDPVTDLTKGPDGFSNFRWFLMQTREKLKGIQYPPNLPQITEANAPSHLMTLMRIQTALEEGQAITGELFNRVISWEKDRLCKDWLATWF